MVIEILMPALSPTMKSGNLVKWCKKVGDKVRSGDVLIEVETDKSTMEYESVESGILAKIFVPEGASGVLVNDLICIFAESGEDLKSLESYESKKTKKENIPEKKEADQPKKQENVHVKHEESRTFISPIAKRLAEEKSLDLKSISGTGPNGRIIKSDVLCAKSERNMATDGIIGRFPDTEISISGMRRVIAERLSFSKSNIPHFYLNMKCQVDDLVNLRKKINEALGSKITVNDMIVKAVAIAMSNFPEVNRYWNETSIVQCGNVDIAVAVDIPDGLVTPIVRNADRLRLSDLSNCTKDLIERARSGKLKGDEYQGGSITISNLGMMGVKSFAAIINPPQASILSISGIFKEPVVDDKDQISIKSLMEIGIAADHRVLDGALCAKFLGEIKKMIENPVLFLV
jgi:pyruvate dehydrogenase E2 component (dihydrolipoamide acetyltransferase)